MNIRMVFKLRKRLRLKYFIFSLGLALVILVFQNGRTTDDSFGKDIYTYRRRFSDNIFSDESFKSVHYNEVLFSERRRNIDKKYDNMSLTGKTSELGIKSHLIIDEKYKLIYCTIEKNGCTFWKRVFQILNGFKNVSDPFDTKAMAAYDGYQTLEKLPFYKIHKALTSSTKFLFVRDPYERLLSGYVDKLFTPYSRFWFDLGRLIIDKFRQKSPSAAPPCGDDVTFEEFIRYYINSWKAGIKVDAHFSSNYEYCRPCEIKYDYIAKVENFKEETLILLEKLNLTQAVKFKDFDSETERDAILQAIAWEFYVYKNVDNCTTKDKVLFKTFKKMQIRGVISKDIPYPFSDVSKVDIDEYKTALLKANADSGPREERKLNRKEAFMEAYHSLPQDLLQELQNIVSVDAELFGYRSKPDIMKVNKTGPFKFRYFDVRESNENKA